MKLEQDTDKIQTTRGKALEKEALPLVALRDVSLGYDSVPVLHGVNVAISPGDLIGVAGPNGSGKTTLFRAILGLLPNSRRYPFTALRIIGIWLCTSERRARSSLSLERERDRGNGSLRPRALVQFFPSEEKERTIQVLEQVGMRHLVRNLFSHVPAGKSSGFLLLAP